MVAVRLYGVFEMAPKRLKKSRTIEDNGKKYQNLNISDALCPICRSIIIEPVTLPCNHSFCLACFNGTVENTTLTCPLCRTRIGSWLRSARKEKTIVNHVFWTNVQIKFPNEIRKRLDGDDVLVEDDNSKIYTHNQTFVLSIYDVHFFRINIMAL